MAGTVASLSSLSVSYWAIRKRLHAREIYRDKRTNDGRNAPEASEAA